MTLAYDSESGADCAKARQKKKSKGDNKRTDRKKGETKQEIG